MYLYRFMETKVSKVNTKLLVVIIVGFFLAFFSSFFLFFAFLFCLSTFPYISGIIFVLTTWICVYRMSCPEPPVPQERRCWPTGGHGGQRDAQRHSDSWRGMLPVSAPASCSQGGGAGSGPDGDAGDSNREVCEAGRELCQLLLILCSMARC